MYRPLLQYPLPKDWQSFERVCLSIFKAFWKDPSALRFGRQGQPQHGVDIYGRPNGAKVWEGVQCKGKDSYTHKKLTQTELKDEVENAKKFEPPISHFYLITTAPRDSKIQKKARLITNDHLARNLFAVTVYSWEDIIELIYEYEPPFAYKAVIGDQPFYDRIRSIIKETVDYTLKVGVNTSRQRIYRQLANSNGSYTEPTNNLTFEGHEDRELIEDSSLVDVIDSERKDDLSENNIASLSAILRNLILTGSSTLEIEKNKLIEMLKKEDSPERKEEIFWKIHSLWQAHEGELLSSLEEALSIVSSNTPKLKVYLDVSVALREGCLKKALSLLNTNYDEKDIYWLQLMANTLILTGSISEAIDYLLQATKLTDNPELLHRTADLAYEEGRFDTALYCMKQLTTITPEDIDAHKNLAALYLKFNDLSNTEEEFQILHRAEPGNTETTLSLANILVLLNKPDESLEYFDQLCHIANPPKHAILGRAQLLQSIGKQNKAYESLARFYDTFKTDPDFLLAFMNIAFIAGEDQAGNAALMALEKLRADGKLAPDIFKRMNLTETLELFKRQMEYVKKRETIIHTEMLNGKMPWVWAEEIAGNPTYSGWRNRNRKLPWIPDNSVYRAKISIYSTNSLHAPDMKNGRRILMPLQCTPTGTRIVADISSLITLSELGLLGKAADYFGEILIPEAYLATVLKDSRRMLLSQQSRKKNMETLKKILDAGSISVCGNNSIDKMPIIAEYDLTQEHHYHMIDLIQPLHSAGNLSDDDLRRFATVQQKESSVDDEHPALEQFQKIRVELTTLEVLVQVGLIEEVAKFFKLFISEVEKNEICDRLVGIGWLEETREKHLALWEYVRNDERYTFVSHTVPEEMKSEEEEDRSYLSFLGEFVSQEKNLPLLVDDRAIQALVLNERTEECFSAFGSDTLINELVENDVLDSNDGANAILQLMKWRYRFILPTAVILKNLASRYMTNPPGKALREVAVYVHDCMRDPGLFSGPENTKLGESMAMRLYQSWLSNISGFLVSVWTDDAFSMETAQHLTKWTVEELIPSTPCVVGGSARVRLGASVNRALISHTLIMSSTSQAAERIIEMISCLKKELRIADEDFNYLITEILDDRNRRKT